MAVTRDRAHLLQHEHLDIATLGLFVVVLERLQAFDGRGVDGEALVVTHDDDVEGFAILRVRNVLELGLEVARIPVGDRVDDPDHPLAVLHPAGLAEGILEERLDQAQLTLLLTEMGSARRNQSVRNQYADLNHDAEQDANEQVVGDSASDHREEYQHLMPPKLPGVDPGLLAGEGRGHVENDSRESRDGKHSHEIGSQYDHTESDHGHEKVCADALRPSQDGHPRAEDLLDGGDSTHGG